MKTTQRIIKIFALVLAGAIIVGIVGAVVSVGALLVQIFDDEPVGESVVIWEGKDDEETVRRLELNIGATSLRILESQNDKEVRVETDSEYIETWREGATLKVVEKSHGFLGFSGKTELTIYIPEGSKFEEVDIGAGAGTVAIERLVAERLSLELGAGRTRIEYLEVSKSAKIDGGAGSMEIVAGKIKDLDLEMGAGKAEITAELTGDSRVESGVGKLDLNLSGRSEDYKISIDKGIGSVSVNGEKQGDGAIYGDGERVIRISSGIGAVEIKVDK